MAFRIYSCLFYDNLRHKNKDEQECKSKLNVRQKEINV